MALLDVEHMTVSFDGLTAVNDLSFSLDEGEILSIIGPNGAGKTTVFNAITGIHPSRSGCICIDGRPAGTPFRFAFGFLLFSAAAAAAAVTPLIINAQSLWSRVIIDNFTFAGDFPWTQAASSLVRFISSLSPADLVLFPAAAFILIMVSGSLFFLRSRRNPEAMAHLGIARTFQNIRLFKSMTAVQNVLAGMDQKLKTGIISSILRFPAFRREETNALHDAEKILEKVGLEGNGDVIASSLSYGLQRRLEIARALAAGPRVLLLDEPAAGMNPAEVRGLVNLIRDIRNMGVTILLIEHDMNVVMDISDRIIVLDYGNKIAEGTPGEIRSNSRVIEAYLGREDER